jgi:hypothetical protein
MDRDPMGPTRGLVEDTIKTITTKFEGKCVVCSAEIPIGSRAVWIRRGEIAHIPCHYHRDDPEYLAGVADANRRKMEREVYGPALAEQFEIEDEMARWNRGEEW